MKTKNTLVIGASENQDRYSYKAIQSLLKHHHPIYAIGNKTGQVDGVEITKEKIKLDDLDTVTLYINPIRQREYYDYIISLKPKRIIFNPGTENEELESLARQNNIQTIEACTLVMLRIGQY
ncbi:MAG TPA: CoA-binding protein [Chitinophagaceae bacterium]|nr:MAG: putative CoA-binding protein [Bacteroidetes bacterium OLB11]HMN32146.1 CoA-binding protein [Chitinophagaceae bacterium]